MATKKLIPDLDMGVTMRWRWPMPSRVPRWSRRRHHVLWQRARRAVGAQLPGGARPVGSSRGTGVPGRRSVLCRRLSPTRRRRPPRYPRQERHRRRERARVALRAGGRDLGRRQRWVVDYLIDAARTYGPDLVYVATGPLSNLALALSAMCGGDVYRPRGRDGRRP